MGNYASGLLVGTGAAINVSLGWVPDYVKVINLTDADMIFEGPLADVINFDSGGTLELMKGDEIYASDGGWSGTIQEVLVRSGTWAGGDAAGWLVLEPGSLEGGANIANNDVIYRRPQQGGTDATNRATVASANRVTVTMQLDPTNGTDGNKMDPAGSNEHILPYHGTSAGAGAGFTLQSSISENDKLLSYQAWICGAG